MCTELPHVPTPRACTHPQALPHPLGPQGLPEFVFSKDSLILEFLAALHLKGQAPSLPRSCQSFKHLLSITS